MINSPYYQQIKPWPHLKGGVNNTGRLEEPQILLDMLWLALEVSSVAGAEWIPQQLWNGTEGLGWQGQQRGQEANPNFMAPGKPRKQQLEVEQARSGQSCSPGRVCTSARESWDSERGKPGMKFTPGTGQDQGRAAG